ncbi:hypothetical protein [Undibacterium sp. CY21W]|uniref:hypothetical protein n=1 Tax=Undibacterium sp. CY21W TaxID=2762293 RepID=UPI00164A3BB0|nr:hypothetical protein [Undibacterium sp. CY21W]MBC3926621.1 hypothetical protein [Undibacterium sp. CY21W]
MNDYKKHAFGEAVKGITAALVGALLLWGGQKWFVSDLEYQRAYKNGYLSAPLGQQGLAMAYNNKPLKNISVVEFGIYNRTQKQHNDVDLMFSVDDAKSSPNLVSGGVIAPAGIPQSQAVEEIPTNDPLVKKFRIKVLPKQNQSEYYHAVFVFDGEKAPEMSVVSLSKEDTLISYQQWRDVFVALSILVGIGLLIGAVMIALQSFIDYFAEPGRHKKNVEKFTSHAVELKKKGELKSTDPEALADAGAIYASFTRPKPSRFWSKVFGAQRYEY